jgi:hypothetical protein
MTLFFIVYFSHFCYIFGKSAAKLVKKFETGKKIYFFSVFLYKNMPFWSERQKKNDNVNRSANADEYLNYEPMQKATRAASRRKTSNRSIHVKINKTIGVN